MTYFGMMAKKRIFNTTSTIFKLLMVVVAAFLVIYFYPREGRFRYQFQEGKPWRYGLLTAPYSFSIYKTEAVLQAERDSLLAGFKPFLQQDVSVLDNMLARWEQDYQSRLASLVPSYYYHYVRDRLTTIYQSGIVSPTTLAQIDKDQAHSVMMVIDKVAESREKASLYTQKSAYQSLLANLPGNIDPSTLNHECRIASYIEENCHYDATTSERVKQELIQSVSLTHGMVQRGERIIDQGEVVSHNTYLKLVSFQRHAEERSRQAGGWWALAGQTIWITMLFAFLFFFLLKFCPEIYQRSSHILFILILMVGLILLSILIVRNDSFLNIYMVPFAILPVMICTFFDSKTAIFSYIITILLCAPIAPFPFEFQMIQLTVGLVSIFSLRKLTQRSQLISCIFFMLLTYVVAYTCLAMLQEGSIKLVHWRMYAYFGVSSVMMLSAYLLIYLFEWLFGFTSNVTLMELANINSPLLREFSETCPGTFQHSLQVSNLASAAAASIGANAELVRAGALYHDLGKMANPSYYTENQSDGNNPLLQLSTQEAVKIITDHVHNGLKIAEKHRLPKVIKEFIQTHHGKAPVRYFYTLYRNEHPDSDVPSYFYYPGPNPFSRETAILMMADTVEAASKSMKEYTEESLSHLVDSMVEKQISEGFFKEVPLTFLEMETIKDVLKEKLRSIYHARIVYPQEK